MNIDQARDILDSAKAGMPVSTSRITQALYLTGDLRVCRPKATQSAIEAAREWPYYAVTQEAT